jgi:cytochrome oxidase Cu insertion factor (SCO1/SenC/PrrC family)
MKKFAVAILALFLTTAAWAQAPAAAKLKVGDTAPDFTLLQFDGQGMKSVSLHDFKGKKNVVLAFYVFAFTGG